MLINQSTSDFDNPLDIKVYKQVTNKGIIMIYICVPPNTI